jgi:hypothetical protein
MSPRRSVEAGDRHQPLDVWQDQGDTRRLLLKLGDLLVEAVDLAQAVVDGVALLNRQVDIAEPLAAGELEPGR